MIEAGRRQPKETPDGRLFSFLLSNPTCDGGQWDMVANLINKHGKNISGRLEQKWTMQNEYIFFQA